MEKGAKLQLFILNGIEKRAKPSPATGSREVGGF
jgi:hypothetical protein